MRRTDADTWDPASSVGATATMVAAARALVSQEDDPLIDDPFAAPLVRAVGIDFFTRVVDGDIDLAAVDDTGGARILTDIMAVRTRFFDDFFIDSAEAGVRQAVILASGLDSRSYRLPWPDGMVVFEIDQPEVIAFKSRVLTDIGARPAADLRAVAVDLRDEWPAALRRNGFDDSVPTAWSAEGLLMYLPPEAQDRLFDDITALSAPGSRLATEYHPDAGAAIADRARAMSGLWGAHGLNLNLGELFYPGERNSVVDYLGQRGWDVRAHPRPEVFAGYGRPFRGGEAMASMRNSLSVIAIRKRDGE
jgi:methyltransferase (TIGR00027 family)